MEEHFFQQLAVSHTTGDENMALSAFEAFFLHRTEVQMMLERIVFLCGRDNSIGHF
jgi:hypothetical protein